MEKEILKMEKLQAEIERLKKELKKKKKYGLVWDSERESEAVVEMCKEKLPVLKEVKSREIITDRSKPVNLLIEGDNYHALSVLNYTHKGKIDVIYIDPPYNTGKANEWKYNDKYVDESDGYKHSKWLNMMEKRLKLSKDLLSNNGIIFISIDDHEQPQLRMICNEIFGEDNFESFIWKKKGGAGNTEKILGNLTEYILCYFKKKKPGILNYRNIERKYKYKDTIGSFNLEGIEKTNLGSYERLTMRFPFIDPKTKKKFFPADNMRWTIGEINSKQAIEEGRIFFDYKKRKVFIIKRPEDYEESENVYYNLLSDLGSLSTAKDELYNIFGNREIFDTPKPTSLIAHLIEISSKEKAIILDFFAGSGTTGQAVLELNKIIKESNRKFILCTNNENKICEEITFPRVKKVIQGYENSKREKVEGLGGNIKYFKTDFVDYKQATDKNKIRLTEEAIEMLCVKEGTFEEVENRVGFKIFKNSEHYAGIIFDQMAIVDFKKSIKDIKGKISVYIFSLGDDSFEDEFEDIKQKVKLSPIPEAILKVYRRIFK